MIQHPDPKDVELALKRYDVIMRYLAAEYAMTLTKNQFFMAVSVGLLTFGAARFPKDTRWSSLAIPLVLTGIGLLISLIWTNENDRAMFYSQRWESLCLQLEALAFGQQEIWRGHRHRSKLRASVRHVASIFLFIWMSVGIAALLAGSHLLRF
jgi:hypothetical protein